MLPWLAGMLLLCASFSVKFQAGAAAGAARQAAAENLEALAQGTHGLPADVLLPESDGPQVLMVLDPNGVICCTCDCTCDCSFAQERLSVSKRHMLRGTAQYW